MSRVILMIHLKQVDFYKVQHWFVDYQKKSKNYEMPPEGAEFWGVFHGEELIGYFITFSYKRGIERVVEINQGYLKSEARHKLYSKIAMQLLEEKAKKLGFNEITLATNRAVGSYQKFMNKCGFGLSKAVFTKRI